MKVTESSLSRIMQHMQNHDTAFMTAWRNARDCGDGKVYTRSENMSRLYDLRKRLSHMGYSFTKVIGRWVDEDGVLQKEVSLFVVDYKDKGGLPKAVFKLGQVFDQDAVLVFPKGKPGYYISTNECPDAWPGFGKIGVKENAGKFKVKSGNMLGTSIGGRWFVFEDDDLTQESLSPQQRYMVGRSLYSKTWFE